MRSRARPLRIKYTLLMLGPAWELSRPLLTALHEVPVIGIIRGCPAAYLEAVAEAATAAGLRAIEVTLDSPDPFVGIEALVDHLPGVVIGAGTVHTTAEVARAADVGARFVVTPFLREDVMSAAVERDLPIVPGAATPTEIHRALDLGAAAVKLFPARELGGPTYLKAIWGPLGRPPLIPTGGVDAENAGAFLEAGAVALGVGGSVFRSGALGAGDAARVGSLASAFLEAIA